MRGGTQTPGKTSEYLRFAQQETGQGRNQIYFTFDLQQMGPERGSMTGIFPLASTSRTRANSHMKVLQIRQQVLTLSVHLRPPNVMTENSSYVRSL